MNFLRHPEQPKPEQETKPVKPITVSLEELHNEQTMEDYGYPLSVIESLQNVADTLTASHISPSVLEQRLEVTEPDRKRLAENGLSIEQITTLIPQGTDLESVIEELSGAGVNCKVRQQKDGRTVIEVIGGHWGFQRLKNIGVPDAVKYEISRKPFGKF